MFDNLVESGSHKEDLSRKGSFLLATLGIYGVIGLVLIVGSILWIDASLDRQDLELTTLVAPVPVPPQQNQPEKQQEAKPQKVDQQNVDVRKELIADVSRTELVPKEVSAKASNIPPVRRGVTTVLGSSDSNAAAPVASGPGTGTGVVAGPTSVNIADEPPPPPPKPAPRAPISGGVLNGKAISLPKPAYPAIARQAHASGTVVVQVTIDENGNVISATPVSGHPLLRGVAVQAARGARFSPTKLSGQPVKVTGVITYNFVAQ